MLVHFPLPVRPAVAALWALDEAMAVIVAEATQPALAAIKLAWWSEALERLDSGSPPAEPRLQAAAQELLTRGITGKQLGRLSTGWTALLDDQPDASDIAVRGQALFAVEAKLLGASDPILEDAGALFALGDARRRGRDGLDDAIANAVERVRGRRVPRSLRPVTLAARLAVRDPVEPEGTPARALALIRHRWSGVIA